MVGDLSRANQRSLGSNLGSWISLQVWLCINMNVSIISRYQALHTGLCSSKTGYQQQQHKPSNTSNFHTRVNTHTHTLTHSVIHISKKDGFLRRGKTLWHLTWHTTVTFAAAVADLQIWRVFPLKRYCCYSSHAETSLYYRGNKKHFAVTHKCFLH